jgi:AAA domain
MTDDAPKLVVRRVADVPRERVRWLWPGYLPVGKVVVLDGDPGLGKSTVTADLAARITIGKPMLDGSGGGDPGAVVLASAEDGLADTIRPRLELAGADLARVAVIEALELADGRSVPLELPGDLEALEAVVRDVGARLVTIDPLMAFLAGTVQASRDQDVRRVLHPVKELAEHTGAAFLVVRHLRKAATETAVQRGGGSIGIIGAARVGLMVARDPADPDRRILAVTKSNVGAIPRPWPTGCCPTTPSGWPRSPGKARRTTGPTTCSAPPSTGRRRSGSWPRSSCASCWPMVLGGAPRSRRPPKRRGSAGGRWRRRRPAWGSMTNDGLSRGSADAGRRGGGCPTTMNDVAYNNNGTRLRPSGP